jgi:hypothetical protein
MPRQRLNTARQVALFALGGLLLVPPVLTMFDRPIRIAGLPLLYLYLFFAWGLLIALVASLAGQLGSDTESTQSAPPGSDGDPPPERTEPAKHA